MAKKNKKKLEEFLACPDCESTDVLVTLEETVYANSWEHYCHSTKPHDDDAAASCAKCDWIGVRKDFLRVLK